MFDIEKSAPGPSPARSSAGTDPSLASSSAGTERGIGGHVEPRVAPIDNHDSILAQQALDQQALDPALNRKIKLVNDAIDKIGWTPYHWKLFLLNGFGYGVDSLALLLQSVIATQAYRELGSGGYSAALTLAVYTGMLLGAICWGLSADIIGRRVAFNSSLVICSIATVTAGAMPTWESLGLFIALVGFGCGGNLILDTTVFLEYLPSNKQWVLTFMACWWGLGQAITGFIAWGFLTPAKWNCETVENCPKFSSNWGWRFTMFTAGALILVMSVLRVTIVRLNETPKYLLGVKKDEEVFELLKGMADKYDRPFSLTLEQLQACGVVGSAHSGNRFSFAEVMVHFRGIFANKEMAKSTLLLWLSWALVGLAYPLFYVFLKDYLESRGATANVSTYDTWRNYALTNVSSIFGPMLAGWMCNSAILGRRYTMTIGALITMALFFAYTRASTPAQNVGFSCAIAFSFNIYYGTLFAYTPEVLPAPHRATGNGVSVAFNRIMGIISAVIGTTANTTSTAPIYVCAGLLGALAILSALFPFEPYRTRSS